MEVVEKRRKLGKVSWRCPTPGVLNYRAADWYRSVAQSVPGRTRIDYLFLFYLSSKSGTLIIKGDFTTSSTVGKRRRKY